MADRAGTPSDDRGTEPLLDWLDEVAAAEGLSREDALEYLISSYWRLEEVVDLLEADDGPIEAAADREPPTDEPDRGDVVGLHERFDTLLSDLRRREGASDEQDALRSSILEMADRLERLEATLTEGHTADATTKLERLRERLESLETTADDRAEAVEELGGDLATVTAGLRELDERLVAVEAETVDRERFEAFADRTASTQQELRGQQDSLRARIHTEFDHIRTILIRLLEDPASDAETVQAIRRELAGLQADREDLGELTRSANRQGTREADCAHCGERVDIGLLRTPTCPVCESRFTDLETVPGFLGLFRSHRLKVDPGSVD